MNQICLKLTDDMLKILKQNMIFFGYTKPQEYFKYILKKDNEELSKISNEMDQIRIDLQVMKDKQDIEFQLRNEQYIRIICALSKLITNINENITDNDLNIGKNSILNKLLPLSKRAIAEGQDVFGMDDFYTLVNSIETEKK